MPGKLRNLASQTFRLSVVVRRFVAPALGLIFLLVCGDVAVSHAASEIELNWIVKGGVDIEPPDPSVTIEEGEVGAPFAVTETELTCDDLDASLGVTLELEISVVPDPIDGLQEFMFSVEWDRDGRNELWFCDFVTAETSGGFVDGETVWQLHQSRAPGGTTTGSYGPMRWCRAPDCMTPGEPSTDVVTLGTMIFRTTSRAANVDEDDVAAFRDLMDTWVTEVDGQPEDVCLALTEEECSEIVVGTASVVPEPALALLEFAALAVVVALRRSSNRGGLRGCSSGV